LVCVAKTETATNNCILILERACYFGKSEIESLLTPDSELIWSNLLFNIFLKTHKVNRGYTF